MTIHRLRWTVLTLLALAFLPAKNASADGGADATAFQIGMVTDDLWRSDTEIDLTNSGANAEPVCVNVYGMNAQAQLAACCTCLVQPNALDHISVNRDLLGTVSQQSKPHTLVIKLLGTSIAAPVAPNPGVGSCNAATVTLGAQAPRSVPTPATVTLSQGMLAWHKTLPITELLPTPASAQVQFAPATLSASELANLTSMCSSLSPTARACNSSCGGTAAATHRPK